MGVAKDAMMLWMAFVTMMVRKTSAVNLTAESTVEEICQLAENPQLCVSSVGESVQGKATAEAVLGEEIEVTLREIDRAEAEAAELADMDKGDPKRDLALQACAEQFQKAENDVKEAAKWLGQKMMLKLDPLLANAMNHLEDCDDSFEDNNLEPLLEETTHQLERLVANCQTLVRAIT